jgi:hypothetical protein
MAVRVQCLDQLSFVSSAPSYQFTPVIHHLRCHVAQDRICWRGSIEAAGPAVLGGGPASFFFCLFAVRWCTDLHAGLAAGGISGGAGASGGGGPGGGGGFLSLN